MAHGWRTVIVCNLWLIIISFKTPCSVRRRRAPPSNTPPLDLRRDNRGETYPSDCFKEKSFVAGPGEARPHRDTKSSRPRRWRSFAPQSVEREERPPGLCSLQTAGRSAGGGGGGGGGGGRASAVEGAPRGRRACTPLGGAPARTGERDDARGRDTPPRDTIVPSFCATYRRTRTGASRSAIRPVFDEWTPIPPRPDLTHCDQKTLFHALPSL